VARSAHAHAEARAFPVPAAPARETRRPAVRDGQRPGPVRAAPAPRAGSRRLSRLPARVLVFVACLALLAAGRVTLSFAVVQKNIQTDAVVRQYRDLEAQNAQLTEQVAGLSSSFSVRNIAVRRYHLAVPERVEYVTVPARAAKRLEARR
jgi:hypothetical protein